MALTGRSILPSDINIYISIIVLCGKQSVRIYDVGYAFNIRVDECTLGKLLKILVKVHLSCPFGETIDKSIASYELQSKLPKEGYIRNYIGTNIGVIKRDSRSLDYSSYRQQVRKALA